MAPVTPRGELGPGEIRTYRCPECGGALTYAVEARSLVCQFCGYRGAVPKGGEWRGARGEGTGGRRAKGPGAEGTGEREDGRPSETAEEQDWDAAIYTARGHRWAPPAERVYVCEGCGSRQVIPPGMEGADCAFCGSPHVAPVEAGADLIAPSGVAPFAFEREEARERAWRWLAGQRFRPHDLDELAAVATPRPVYLSYWTFDLSGELTWHGYRKGELGRRVAVSGSHPVLADDVPVPAGGVLPEETLAALQFDTRALAPYTPDLLAGWSAEVYRLPLADASLRARERVVAEARPRIEAEVGQGVEELRVGSAGLSVASYKLALLPVWLAGYAYKGERRSLVVNGQSGEVHGEVPRNPLQAFLARLGE
jgi:DNA-directed RNA polymerase subunit RPC12/RpoP